MQDEIIIKRLCADLKINLNKIDSYEWDKVGYVLDSEGRVNILNLHSILEIKKLPDYINELKELTILHIVGNGLESIEEIKDLINLEILALQANKIKDISVLKGLHKLKELYVGYNPLSSISSIKNLKELRKLDISNNKIINFNPISSIVNLTSLSVGIKELSKPQFLKNCNKLKEIIFFNHLNEKFENGDVVLNCIENLNLEGITFNSFSSFDIDKFLKHSKLKVLGLNNSVIKNIESIIEFKELKNLSLRNNYIEDIQFISELKQLEYLDISYNNIRKLDSLLTLKKIKSIDLSGNPINDLYSILGLNMEFVYEVKHYFSSSKQNQILISECNEINNPPIEIVKQGNEAILRYFKKIEEEGIDYIYEAKLILVGEGSAGKTSLQKRLLNKKAELPKSDKRTRGIEVVDFKFKATRTAHIWDFGGQDVYYPVHRFFITENAVFVLLASTRQTTHNFDYWIPTIFQFGGKSPIIIGQTCHDGNTAPWNDLDIYVSNSNFNIIKTSDVPYYKIDLPNQNKGLDTIKKTIINQIENLHHFGKGVPKSWLTIRNAIIKESQSKSCITFESFVDLCRRVESKRLTDILDIEDCCRFLHDIGVILWYSKTEALKDWVILEPEWAMNAVYKIIDDSEIQQRNGIIYENDFNRLWEGPSYESKYNILKKMLETFKIAFLKKHTIGDYIIPARLNSIPNEKKWHLNEKCLRLEYRFEFMPRGIVNQLSAELSRYILNDDVWNNAVNLAYYDNETNSQIIEDSYNRTLSIASKGNDARGMNILIMDAMKNIIDTYKGVKGKIYVSCTCKVCQDLTSPTLFLYDKLIEWGKKREEVNCNESGEDLKIKELLFNAGFGKDIEVKKKQKVNKTITIFLASSLELKEERDQFEIFINRENKKLNEEGIFIRLEVWEDFIDAMSDTRLQDEYNKAVTNSDIFISLFFTKVGKFTAEEFGKAFGQFKETGKPYIYTFFKHSDINIGKMNKDDINSKFEFEDKLKQLEHFPTIYKNIEDLKFQFKNQLDKLLPKLIM